MKCTIFNFNLLLSYLVLYVQGMNELFAPLYYMFKNDPDQSSARYAEADAFYCFVDLISEFRDHFCQQLDNSSSGIKATIQKLVALLEAHDPELAAHLAENKVRMGGGSGVIVWRGGGCRRRGGAGRANGGARERQSKGKGGTGDWREMVLV